VSKLGRSNVTESAEGDWLVWI